MADFDAGRGEAAEQTPTGEGPAVAEGGGRSAAEAAEAAPAGDLFSDGMDTGPKLPSLSPQAPAAAADPLSEAELQKYGTAEFGGVLWEAGAGQEASVLKNLKLMKTAELNSGSRSKAGLAKIWADAARGMLVDMIKFHIPAEGGGARAEAEKKGVEDTAAAAPPPEAAKPPPPPAGKRGGAGGSSSDDESEAAAPKKEPAAAAAPPPAPEPAKKKREDLLSNKALEEWANAEYPGIFEGADRQDIREIRIHLFNARFPEARGGGTDRAAKSKEWLDAELKHKANQKEAARKKAEQDAKPRVAQMWDDDALEASLPDAMDRSSLEREVRTAAGRPIPADPRERDAFYSLGSRAQEAFHNFFRVRAENERLKQRGDEERAARARAQERADAAKAGREAQEEEPRRDGESRRGTGGAGGTRGPRPGATSGGESDNSQVKNLVDKTDGKLSAKQAAALLEIAKQFGTSPKLRGATKTHYERLAAFISNPGPRAIDQALRAARVLSAEDQFAARGRQGAPMSDANKAAYAKAAPDL